ncbi:MAG: amidohydrolase family protein [Candidatus Hodarchaeota archaeon]
MNKSVLDSREIIDTHVHPIRSLATGMSLINEMDDAGISKAVLLALDLDKELLDNDSNLKDEIVYDILSYSLFIDPYRLLDAMKQMLKIGNTPNTLIAELVKSFPDKFVGFGSVNPRKNSKYVKEKLKEIDKLGLKGVKLLPTLQFFKPTGKLDGFFLSNKRQINYNLNLIFQYAKNKNLPILIHPGKDPGPWEIHTLRYVQGSHPKNWKPIIKRFKNNKIIFAHLGCYGCDSYDDSWLGECLSLATQYPFIYLDTSAVPYHLENQTIVDKIRETCSFNRILFGTDTPVVQGVNMKYNVKVIENSPFLTDDEKAKIFSENAKSLLSL